MDNWSVHQSDPIFNADLVSLNDEDNDDSLENAAMRTQRRAAPTFKDQERKLNKPTLSLHKGITN